MRYLCLTRFLRALCPFVEKTGKPQSDGLGAAVGSTMYCLLSLIVHWNFSHNRHDFYSTNGWGLFPPVSLPIIIAPSKAVLINTTNYKQEKNI